MKTCQSTGYFQQVYVILLLCLVSSIVSAGSVFALTGNNIDQCYDCHGSSGDMRPLDTSAASLASYRNITTGDLKGNHRTHVNIPATWGNVYVCAPCHTLPAAPPTGLFHREGQINMKLNIHSSASVRGVYSNKGVFFNQTSNPVLGTCTNVNCHFRTTTPTWGSAALVGGQTAANCQLCHPSTGMATGNHTKHIIKYGSLITVCSNCHNNRTTFDHASSAMTGKSINITLAGAPYGTGTYTGSGTHKNYPNYLDGTGTYNSCNTVYCHSSAQSATGGAPPVYKPVTWNGAALACNGCHGYSGAPPDLTSGSHSAHVSTATYGFVCADCHGADGSGTGANHANQTINLDLTLNRGATAAYVGGDGTPLNSNFGVCNNTYCHGQNSSTWGTTVSTTLCTKCHGQANFAYTNTTSAQIAPGGTGVDTGGHTLATDPRVGAHQVHLTASDAFSDTIHCGECHVPVTSTPAALATHLNRTTATVTLNGRALAQSHTPSVTRTGGIITCSNTYCHTGHLNSGTTMTPVWNNSSYIATVVGVVDCNKCHGLPPRKTFGHASTAVITAPTQIALLCSGCHSRLNTVAQASWLNVFTDKTKHVYGDAGAGGHAVPFPGATHMGYAGATTPSTVCGSCHNYQTAGAYPAPTLGNAPACMGCHTLGLLRTVSSVASCYDCHGATAIDGRPVAATFPNISGSHTKSGHVSQPCATCHVGGGTTTANHGSQNRIAKTRANVTVAFASGTWSSAAMTCGNLACHSTVQSANGSALGVNDVATPSWGSGTANCTTNCHGQDATRLTTGSHTKHLSTTLHATYTCNNCHTGAGKGTALHADGTIQVQQSALVGGTGTYSTPSSAPASGFGSCDSTYCHSSVQSATGGAPPTYVKVTWGSGALTCSGCHGSTAADLLSGTHSLHLNAAYGFACTACHGAAGTGNTASHANQTIDISLTNYGATATYSGDGTPQNSNFGRCANTFCHGTLASPTWGTMTAVPLCQKCHGYISTSAWKSLAGATVNTDPKVGGHFNHISSSGAVKYVHELSCKECHTNSIALLTDSPATAGHTPALPPAQVAFGPLASTKSVAAGGSASYAAGVCSLVYCHGAGMDSNISNPPASRVASPTWSTPYLGVASVVGNGSTTPGSGDCSKCHGYPPMTSTHAGKIATDCKGCHTHVNAAGTGFDNATLHVNGVVDAQGGDCTGCHNSAQPTAAPRRVAIMKDFTGSRNSHHYQGTAKLDKTVCYACHWESDATGSTTSHHREQTAGFKDHVQLVVWGTSTTRPTAYTAGVSYVLYSSGGTSNSTRVELAKINTHCLGCHNDTNKTTAPFATDSGTPSKYSWEAQPTTAGGFSLAQSIASKYLSTTTTNWGKFAVANNVNNKQPVVKAFSAHGNAAVNQRGWSTIMEGWNTTVANYPNTSGAVQVLCFDCHNSHGSSSAAPANAVTTSYSSATGRGRGGILKTTTANLGGYTVSYRPYTGGNAAQKNPYKTGAGLCFDCHNNATAGLPTSTGFVSPWGYSGVFGSSAMIHGYNDEPYFGKAGGVFAKGVTFPYIGTGRPNNQGGHFNASSPLSTTPVRKIGGVCTPCHDPHGVSPGLAPADQPYAVPMLKGTYVTSPYKQDAAPPLNTETRGGGSGQTPLSHGRTIGYHIDMNTMQAATTGKPAVARYWTFATSASTLQTLNASQFAGLCTQCHTQAALNSTAAATSANWKSVGRIHNAVKGWALTSGTGGNLNNKVHAYTCSKCHSSHNSMLPRLLVTNCLDVKHAGRLASGGNVNLINTGSGNSGAGLGRFPGGGSYGHSRRISTATNPGPWFFGVRQSTLVTTTNLITTTTCHDSATAGGAWSGTGTEQQWNTKSQW